MINLVKSPPNHYDVLGLTPAAGDGEIVFAFTRKMSMFGAHQPEEAAQICAAYEVLRNAEKRREYDRSLGLGAKPATPRQWAFSMSQQQWPGFAGPATASAVYAPASATAPEAELEVPEPQVARGSTIAERLLRLAEPTEYDGMAGPQPHPLTARVAAPEPEAALPWAVEQDPAELTIREILARDEDSFSEETDRQPIPWRRPAIVAGGLVAAAGLVGVLAGFTVEDGAASVVRSPVVAAPPQGAEAASAPIAAASPVETKAATPVSAAAPVTLHASSSSRYVRPAVAKPDAADSEQPTDVAAADIAQAQPENAKIVTASMPLPDRVVARTIEKIGYSCGSVASTAAVEGASGTFKVTCSSGQTYRATPVRGHYRFKRSAG